MRSKHEIPTASLWFVASADRRRGNLCAAFNPADFHLSSPVSSWSIAQGLQWKGAILTCGE
jgi:hypothetical protein